MTRPPAARGDVLALVGPTASGKTPLSILVARELGAEIISADSRQMYRLMDIGTAKPTRAERGEIPHHFIDDRSPDDDFSAACDIVDCDLGDIGIELGLIGVAPPFA